LSADDLHAVVNSDGSLNAAELKLELADQLHSAGPWGQNFPEPIFEGVFEVINQRIVGERHIKLNLRAENNTQLDAIAFNQEDLSDLTGLRVNLAYRLDANELRGMRNLQLVVEHIEHC
jgi:single-stranded-DNA-specific exonuclease